jgi:hypothetical protein
MTSEEVWHPQDKTVTTEAMSCSEGAGGIRFGPHWTLLHISFISALHISANLVNVLELCAG